MTAPDDPLPPRTAEAEDRWLSDLPDRGLTDDAVAELVSASLADRRPALAARLVQLLGDDADHPALDRARQAARMLLVAGGRPDPAAVAALEDAWQAARTRWMQRAKARHRQALRSAAASGLGVATPPGARRKPRRG